MGSVLRDRAMCTDKNYAAECVSEQARHTESPVGAGCGVPTSEQRMSRAIVTQIGSRSRPDWGADYMRLALGASTVGEPA